MVGHVQEKNRSDFPPGSGQVLLRMLRSKHVLNVFDEMERPHVNKESGISRIVGGSPEEEAAALREFKERFERRESGEGLEREKTPEEMETIRAIAQAMPEFLARYHAQAVPIAPEQIHFIDVARLPDEARERVRKLDEQGRYWPDAQAVAIFPRGDLVNDARAVVHEILHIQSFASYTKKGEDLERRRAGLSIFSEGGRAVHFDKFDEAVIEELTRRFVEQYFDTIPAVREAIRRRVEMAPFATNQPSGGARQTTIEPYAYPASRAKLWTLIDGIYERSRQEFASRETVFALFAEAALNGKMLPVARAIEKAYGKGKFHELAEETKELLT